MGKKTWTLPSLFGLLLVAFSCGHLAPAAKASPPQSLEDQVSQALGLRASNVAEVKVMQGRENGFSVAVPLDDDLVTLELEPHSVRSPEYRVEVDFGGGELGEVPAGPVRTYRGAVAGQPASLVAAFEGDDGLHAKIVLPDGSRYWVEPVAGRVPGAAGNLHAVYRNEDVIPSMGSCDAHDGMRMQEKALEGAVASTSCGAGPCVAEVAADADVEFYLAYGSVAGVENRINAIINGLNVEYERDVGIRHVISSIIVRIAEPDPYTSTAAQTLLNEFRTHWQNNHTSVPRDTAELFTGKNIDGSTIGIAWIGAICGSYGYSVVQADCCSSFACATDLSAHELGHNWNAGHCTCTGTTMNPSLTCSNLFHPTYSIPTITSFRDSRTCLGSVGGCTFNSDCDDANPCTTDNCVSGSCVRTNNTGPCNDGLYCNGADACSGGSCSVHTGNPCTGGAVCANVCNESADNCFAAANTACTADTNPCTNDVCNGSGLCTHPLKPTGSSCNDSLYCNGADTCSSTGVCLHSGNPCTGGAECANVCNETADNCLVAANTACTADSNPCTNDVCNGMGGCAHPLKPAGSLCNDNLYCNGTDTCSTTGICLHSGNPCPGADGDLDCSESCNETADACTANDPNGTSCGSGDSCQDGLCVTDSYCGDDVCDAGETCASCPADCGFPNNTPCTSGADCCSGRCRKGRCRP